MKYTSSYVATNGMRLVVTYAEGKATISDTSIKFQDADVRMYDRQGTLIAEAFQVTASINTNASMWAWMAEHIGSRIVADMHKALGLTEAVPEEEETRADPYKRPTEPTVYKHTDDATESAVLMKLLDSGKLNQADYVKAYEEVTRALDEDTVRITREDDQYHGRT